MKIKSMIAALAASALAIGAMAVPTFAEEGDPVWYGGAFGVNSTSTNWTTTEWGVNEDPIGNGKVAATLVEGTTYEVRLDNPFSDAEEYAQVVFQTYGPDDCSLKSVYLEGPNVEYDLGTLEEGDQNFTCYLLGSNQAGTIQGIFETPEDVAAITAIVWTFDCPQADDHLGQNPEETTTAAEGTTTTAAGTTTTAAGNAGGATTTKPAATTAAATKTGDTGVGVVVAALTLAGAAAYVARKKG